MRDIALQWNAVTGGADFAVSAGDFVTDAGLETAVILSLFVDRLAAPGDVIPDGSDDRRGWWGDLPVAQSADGAAAPDLIGSRLWLITRALQTTETLRRAESYAEEALAWMVEDGVAGSVSAAASYPQSGTIQLSVTIGQAGASRVFDFAWQAS